MLMSKKAVNDSQILFIIFATNTATKIVLKGTILLSDNAKLSQY
jgi:hypothetical protein